MDIFNEPCKAVRNNDIDINEIKYLDTRNDGLKKIKEFEEKQRNMYREGTDKINASSGSLFSITQDVELDGEYDDLYVRNKNIDISYKPKGSDSFHALFSLNPHKGVMHIWDYDKNGCPSTTNLNNLEFQNLDILRKKDLKDYCFLVEQVTGNKISDRVKESVFQNHTQKRISSLIK